MTSCCPIRVLVTLAKDASTQLWRCAAASVACCSPAGSPQMQAASPLHQHPISSRTCSACTPVWMQSTKDICVTIDSDSLVC
jgi:hypothetical protein